jgi:hypothetical protein
MDFAVKVHKVSGDDVAVWDDGSAICIKTRSGYGDPVELTTEEALELATILMALASDRSPGAPA